MPRRRAALLPFLAFVAACAPAAAALPGAPAPAAQVPRAELAPGRHRIVYEWSYEDADMLGSGEAVARVAAPDSARLDLFLRGGLGSGAAVLVGDEVRLPSGGDFIRRFVPPPPLLWAGLGRLAVPAAPDTVARVDGDTIRADIGRDPVWRATFAGPRLVRLERIEDGRIVEWVKRDSTGSARYRDERGGRSLELRMRRSEPATEFDPRIWRF